MKCFYVPGIDCALSLISAASQDDCFICGFLGDALKVTDDTTFAEWFDFYTGRIEKLSAEATRPIPDEVEQARDILRKTGGWIVWAGLRRAEAENFLTGKYAEVTEALLKDPNYEKASKFPAKAFNMLVDGKTGRELRAYRILERLGATLTHKQAALITEVSYAKSINKAT